MIKPTHIHVAVAVIRNCKNEVLIARRPPHVHQGGRWEFPGGKLESDEDSLSALVRECQEELAITPLLPRPLIKISHDYTEKSVLLDVWLVEKYSGKAIGCENQIIRWVNIRELADYQFPDANLPIISAVQLPSTYMVTPEPGDDIAQFLQQIRQSISKFKIQLLQFRAKSMSLTRYTEYAKAVCAVSHSAGAKVLLNANPDLVSLVGADGVHLTSRQLSTYCSRPLDAPFIVAASCHNREELQLATAIGVDFVVLGPVKTTATHPSTAALGWQQFANLTEIANYPVYALGGMTLADIAIAQKYGAQGIAAIRTLNIQT